MVSSPKSGGGGNQAQAAPQAPPAGTPGMAPPGAQGVQADAPGGMDPAVKTALLRQMLAQAQTPAMGFNAPHNMRGGGGNPGQR